MELRFPNDGKGDEVSASCAKSFVGVKDMCRQDLTPDTDLNRLLATYSPFELAARQPYYGERNYDRDMHDDMLTSRRAYEVWVGNDEARGAMTFEEFLKQVPDDAVVVEVPEEPAPEPKPESVT